MKITPAKKMRGTFSVPGDKSISHRAVMLGSLAHGVTKINGFLKAADCLSTISCFSKLGVKTETDGDTVLVYGGGLNSLTPPAEILYTGNSGTTTRLLCGILSGQPFESCISGDESICRRPMRRVIEPLSRMGASISAKGGNYCPLEIKKSVLHGIDYTLPVASAQLKSSLLLAGLFASGKTIIRENGLSRDHTELMMKRFGADLEVSGSVITLTPGKKLQACQISVPGDISSAAFFIVAALITEGSKIKIENVGLNPRRTGIIDALKNMGADIEISDVKDDGELSGSITARSSRLHGTVIGGGIIPRMIDEIPVLAVAASVAQGQTVIKDASELLYKESNRILTTAQELKKAGADIFPTEDGFIINGGALHGAVYESHLDHRIAMAMAIASLAADGPSEINNCEAVDISYPSFFETLGELASGGFAPSAPVCSKKNIALSGFMGSGKTTTGKALAEISGFSFVDTDALIEESEKASIPEIFSERGEEYFRKAESEAIFSLSRAKNTVIAVGGGAVLRRRNVESLKKHSVLVFLDAPPEKILLNLASDQGRPLINGKSDEEIIRLYENRRPVYLETADIVLDASGMDTDEIVSKILAKL